MRSIPGPQARLFLFAAALVACVANVVADLPGKMTPDQINQYREAVSGHFTDWHPPVMAFVWSLLRRLWDGPQPMLILQVGLHWLGFWLLADGLDRVGRTRAGWLMLVAGAFPVFLAEGATVSKDVGMASSLLTAFAVAFWFRVQGRRLPGPGVAVALLCLTYGLLVRANAIFAFGPLLLYICGLASRLTSFRMVIASVLLAVVAIPLASFVNSAVIGAKSTDTIDALFIFDLAGIAHVSKDPAIFPSRAELSADELSECYIAYSWDSFSQWGNCSEVAERFNMFAHDRAAEFDQIRQQTGGTGLRKTWMHAIAEHPLAYLTHRLKHYNSELLFFVPAKHSRFVKWINEPEPSENEILFDYVRKPIFIWPVVWLSFGLCSLWLLARFPLSPAVSAGNALLVSGIGYCLGYAVVGVATAIRYHYWTIMAVMLALIVAYPVLADRLSRSRRDVLTVSCVIGIVIAVGLYARMTGNMSLMR